MNDDLHSFIEPELEARIVALVLGEAFAFEKEELERIIAERPEVAIWKRRIESVHGLVAEASRPAKALDQQKWMLSEDRREKVLSTFQDVEAATAVPSEMPEKRISAAQRRALLSIAACVVVAFIFITLISSNLKSERSNSEVFMMDEADAKGGDFVDSLQSDFSRPQVRMVIPEASTSYGLMILDDEAKVGVNFSSESALASIGDAMISNEIVPPTPARGQEGLNTFFGSTLSIGEVESAGSVTRSVRFNERDSGLVADLNIPAETPAAPGAAINLGEVDQPELAISQTRSGEQSFEVSPAATPMPEARQDLSRKFVKLRKANLADGEDFFYEETEGLRRAGEKTPASVTVAGALVGRGAQSADTFIRKASPTEQERRVGDENTANLRSNGKMSEDIGVFTGVATGGVGGGGGGGMVDATALAELGLEEQSLQLKRVEVSLDPFSAPADDAKSASAKPAQPTGFAIGENEPKQIEVNTKGRWFDDQVTEGKADGSDNGRVVTRGRMPNGKGPESLYDSNSDWAYSGEYVKDGAIVRARNGWGVSVNGGLAGAPVQDRSTQSGREYDRDHGRGFSGIVSGNEGGKVDLAKQPKGLAGKDAEANSATNYRVLSRDWVSKDKTRGGESIAEELGTIDQKTDGYHWAAQLNSESENVRDLQTEVLDADPKSVAAKQQPEYFNDPIRTNQALDYDRFSRRSREEIVAEVKKNWEAEITGLPELEPLSSEEVKDKELAEIQDVLEDKKKALGDLLMSNGLSFADLNGSRSQSPVGLTEERIYQNAPQRLDELEQDRDLLKIQLDEIVKAGDGEQIQTVAGLEIPENEVSHLYNNYQETMREIDTLGSSGVGENHPSMVPLKRRAARTLEEARVTTEELKEVLKARMSLVDGLVERMKETTLSKKDITVDLSMRQHELNSAMEEYEQSRDLMREMRIHRGFGGDADAITKAKVALMSFTTVGFQDATFEEALDYLRMRSSELDLATLNDEEKGLKFVFEGDVSKLPVIEELNIKDAPFEKVIELIAEATGTRVKIEEGKVVFTKPNLQKKVPAVISKLETLVSEKSDSTFSLNVSDVSFKMAKAALAEGRWPDASKVRPEEFVNAFDYGDTKPNQAEKVSCLIEQGSHPFMQQRSLMRVALSTAALGRNASTPLRLTILLDQSGSMERNDRAESVRRAFDLLAAQLTPADEVTLVGFARTPRLLAERVKGDQCAKLLQIVNNTPTEGGTNLEEALTVGLQLAKQQFFENAQNRIILLTDGAANLGDALPESLSKEVEKMRRAGVSFDACGVGADGFNDDILSALTKQGDGRYYFLDRPEDADEGFARQIAGALRPSAKNVKVQVIFNPDRVERYKLYGFEKHQLKKEDFRNDSVDAAEMAAEESGVAMYHYQAMPQGRGDVGSVSVRFQDVGSGKMIERTWNIPYEPSMADFSQATPSLQLAGSAALFGERLKGSLVGERVDLGELRRSVSSLRGTFGGQRRFEELRTMLEQASR